jgi:hypothetical protein
MGILLPETCWGNKTAYFVASSWFFIFTMSTMHGHMNIKHSVVYSTYQTTRRHTPEHHSTKFICNFVSISFLNNFCCNFLFIQRSPCNANSQLQLNISLPFALSSVLSYSRLSTNFLKSTRLPLLFSCIICHFYFRVLLTELRVSFTTLKLWLLA